MVKESLIFIIITTKNMVMFTFNIQANRYQSFFFILLIFFSFNFQCFCNSFLIGKIEWFEREWLTQIQIHMDNLYHIQIVDTFFFVHVVKTENNRFWSVQVLFNHFC